jgi:hypothetical protein
MAISVLLRADASKFAPGIMLKCIAQFSEIELDGNDSPYVEASLF